MQQPVCRRCKQQEAFGRKLFKCTVCRRSYHAACCRPVPTTHRDDWICSSCKHKAEQQRKLERYNEILSLPAFLSRTSLSSGSSTFPSNMAPLSSSFPITDPGSASLQPRSCSYPGCEVIAKSNLCPDHLRKMKGIKGSPSGTSLNRSTSSTSSSWTHQKRDTPSIGASLRISNDAARSHSRDSATGQDSPSQQQGFVSGNIASLGDNPARKKARLELSASDWDGGFSVRSVASHGTRTMKGSGLYQSALPFKTLRVEPKAAIPPHIPARTEKKPGTKVKDEISDHFRSSVRARFEADPRQISASDDCGPANKPFSALHESADLSPSSRSATSGLAVEPSQGYNLQIKSWFARQAEKQAASRDISKGVITQETARKISVGVTNGTTSPQAPTQVLPQPDQPADKVKAPSAPVASKAGPIAEIKGPVDLDRVTGLFATEIVRQRLVERCDDSIMDSLIYGQSGASKPPPGLEVAPLPKPKHTKDEAFYAHIDPRVHWTRPRSARWHEGKMKEIKARGNRKANFGKVAQHTPGQRTQEEPLSFEDALSEKVKANPGWANSMKWFRECDQKQWEKDKAVSLPQVSNDSGKKTRRFVNGARKRT